MGEVSDTVRFASFLSVEDGIHSYKLFCPGFPIQEYLRNKSGRRRQKRREVDQSLLKPEAQIHWSTIFPLLLMTLDQ